LADIKRFQLLTAFYNGLDANTSYADAASDGQLSEFQQMEAYTSEGRIGDGTAAER